MKANKILLFIVAIALIFTIGNLILNKNRITGEATDTGEANLTILSAASIEFTVNSIEWGAGAVYENSTNATLNSEGVVMGGNWTAVSEALKLQNNGNTDVSLTITTSNIASTFIGGSAAGGPSYKLRVSNNETGSCGLPLNSTNLGIYTEATGSAQSTCGNFTFGNSNDLLDIDVEIRIPEDALPGTKSSVITATANVI